MSGLLSHPWLLGCDVASTPLMTPDVLTASVEYGVATAFSAFHKATREGFRLQVLLISLINL